MENCRECGCKEAEPGREFCGTCLYEMETGARNQEAADLDREQYEEREALRREG